MIMKKIIFVTFATVTLAGCASDTDLDKVMGRSVEGTPTTAPEPERKIDCDLIFPGGSTRDKS